MPPKAQAKLRRRLANLEGAYRRELEALRKRLELGGESEERARKEIENLFPPRVVPFDQPDQASRFEFERRRSPSTGQVPVAQLLAAGAQASRMRGGALGPPAPLMVRPIANAKDALEADPRTVSAPGKASPGAPFAGLNGWTSIGPGNIGGRVRGLVVQPNNVIYAGGVAGGIWKSTNGGDTWAFQSGFMANLAISTIVASPTDPQVLYAGTGEGFNNADSVAGLGIFKTTDGGASWNPLTATIGSDFFYVNKLALSPNNPQVLYAATSSGVHRSTDGGATWSTRTSGAFLDLVVRDNVGVDNLFAWRRSDTVYRSLDGGETFASSGSGIAAGQRRGSLAVSADGSKLYVAVAGSAGLLGSNSLVGVYRSTDNGSTWEQRCDLSDSPQGALNKLLFTNPPYGLDANRDGSSDCYGISVWYLNQGWYDNAIAVDPTNSDRVWVGGIDLFRSDDGGVSFGIASFWEREESDPNYAHADHHAITFDPGFNGTTNQRIYFGNDGGVCRTDNGNAAVGDLSAVCGPSSTGTVTFTGLNHGLGITQYYHGAAARSGEIYIGGTQDNGTHKFNPSSPANDWFKIFGGDGGYCAIDQDNPNVLYLETTNLSLRKSSDGGATSASARSGISEDSGNFLFIAPFAMDPAQSSRLWIGGLQPWRSLDAAQSWVSASSGGTVVSEGSISAWGIAAPGEGNVVYLGSSSGQIFRSTNALAANPSWVNLTKSPLPTFAYVSAIAVHPANSDIAFATFSSYNLSECVFRTVDGGATWQAIQGSGTGRLPNSPVDSIAIHPANPSRLYVGTEIGVFASEDGGDTWVNVNNPGMSNTVVSALVFQGTSRLLAFTHGRGVFVADIDVAPSPLLSVRAFEPETLTLQADATMSVGVVVSNDGTAVATVHALELILSSGSLSGSTLTVEAALGPGQTSRYQVPVTAVSAGFCQITSLAVRATNANDGSPTGVWKNMAAPVTIEVTEAGPLLELTGIQVERAQASTGQTFPVTVTLKNSGTAPARVTSASLILEGSSLSAPPWEGELDVAAVDGEAKLVFSVAAVSEGVSRITSVRLDARSLSTGRPAHLVANRAAPVTVQVAASGPVLRLESIQSAVSALAIGESTAVTVTLRNDGNIGADLFLVRLVFSNSRLSAPDWTAVSYVSASSGRTRYTFQVTAMSEGPCDITSAEISATSEGTGGRVGLVENQSSPVRVTVVRPGPVLTLVSMLAERTRIGIGHTIPLTVTIRNDGTSAADVSGARLLFSNGNASSPPLGASPGIAASGGFAKLTFSVSGVSAGVCSVTSAALTATSSFDGQAAVLAANLASPVSLDITSALPAIKLVRLSPTRDRLNVNQSTTVTASLRNDGTATALISKVWLGLWNSRLSAAPAAPALSLSPGASGDAVATITGKAAGSSGITTVTLTATNALTGQAVGVAANLVQALPVTVQTPASIVAEPLRLARTAVVRGQSGVRVDTRLANAGSAATGASAHGLSATLFIKPIPAGFTVSPRPIGEGEIPAAQSAIVTWIVDVLATAPLGPSTLSAELRAYDSNSSEPCPVSNPADATLTVLSPATLSVDSLTVSTSTVVRGQTGIVVRAGLTNTASASTGTTASSLGGALLFGGTAAGYRVTADPANPAQLAAGQSAVLTFSVDVLDHAPRGATLLTARPSARDGVGGMLVPFTSAASATWTVLAPGALEVTSLAPSLAVLSRGQTGQPLRVGVRNAGDLPIRLAGAPLFAGSTAGFAALPGPANATTLTTGQSALLTWTVDVLGTAPLGPVSVASGLLASDSASGLPAAFSDPVRGTWSIQSAAALRVDSVRPGRSEIVQGLTRVPVTVSVTNSGLATSGARADGLSSALRFNGLSTGYTASPAPSNALTLAAARSTLLTFSVDVLPSTTAGAVALTAQVQASDANSGAPASVVNTVSAAWTVKTPAALRVTGVVPASSTATQGQRRLPVEVSISNTGQTTCEGLRAGLTFAQYTGFLTAAPLPGNPVRLAGGATTVLTFSVDVRGDTPALTIPVGAQADGREAMAGTALTAAAVVPATLRILQPAALLATDWHAAPRRVSRGQTGVPLELAISNGGQTGLSRLAATLTFPGAAGLFRPSARPGNATVLASGGSCVLTFSVDVLPQAPLGSAEVTAVVTAVGDGSGHLLSWTVAPAASWTVVEPAALSLTAVRLSRGTVTHGQRGVRLEIAAANRGQAEADGIIATPLFGGGTGGFLVLPDAANPTTLATASTITLTFTAEVLPGAPPGAITVTAALAGRDRPSGNPCVVTTGPSAVWTVQTTPVLGLETLAVWPATLAVGQSATVTAAFRSERADSAAVRFSRWQPVSSASAVLGSTYAALAGVELAGGSQRVFAGSVTARAPGTSTLFAALADAVDVNTGLPIPLSWNHVTQPPLVAVGRPPTARVTGPASLLVVDGRPRPVRLDAGGSSDPDGGTLGFTWRQVSGPAVPPLPAGTATVFVPLTAAGRYEFAVTVTDGLGLTAAAATGFEVFANASPAIVLPSALAGLTHERMAIPVSASDPDGDPITFDWRQETGPITLTFFDTAPASPTLRVSGPEPGSYRLRLTASDPRSGLSSSTVNLQLTSAPLAPLELGIGVNLVAVPVSPFTTDGHVYSSADLARDTGGSIIARLSLSPTGWTRFTPDLPALGKPFPILPGEGYAVICRRPMRVRLPGRNWPGTASTVILRPRLVLVGYPVGVPAGETAQLLGTRTGARFVARTRVDPTGHARFEVHVPGLTPPFAIRPGEGYLFSVESKTNAVLPGGP